jgi:hypothetical protein
VVWFYARRNTDNASVALAGNQTITLLLRDGRKLEVKGVAKGPAAQIQELLTSRIPWAFSGYDPNLRSFWQKDRATFIHQVDARRAAYTQTGVPPSPGTWAR